MRANQAWRVIGAAGALLLIFASCSGEGRPDAQGRDAAIDAVACDEFVHLDGLVPLPDLNVLHWVGEATTDGALPVAVNNRYVTAALLHEHEFERSWYIRRDEDSAGALRWDGRSAAGPMRRRQDMWSVLDVRYYFLWRPNSADPAEVELPVFTRWPYGGLGACGVDNEQVVPTQARLWFFRRNQCEGDPDRGSDVRARLHGFDATGGDVTPAEGVPLLGEVLWYTTLVSPMQPHADDGVSYIISDRGPAGIEEEALHWERRDVTGALVARSDALVSRADVVATGNIWGAVTDDDAYLFYAHATRGPAAVFARIERDGAIRWAHRFEGFVANDERNRSRVQAYRGGMVALLSRLDGSERTVVRIAADGVIELAPGVIDLGSGPSPNAAVAADDWGVTAVVGASDATEPITLSRHDWTGAVLFSRRVEDSDLVDRFLLARPDNRGGAYVFAFSPIRVAFFQHYDALGRPAAWYRNTSCIGRDTVHEAIPYERNNALLPDAGTPDAWTRDAAPDLDGGVAPMDAGLATDE